MKHNEQFEAKTEKAEAGIADKMIKESVMKEWLNVLIKYDKTGNVGNCPKCGEKAVAVTMHIRENGTRSITFRCEACKKGMHFN